jgi:hypothetical protein
MHLLVPPSAPDWPGGLDPDLLSTRPSWQHFLPARWRRRAASS